MSVAVDFVRSMVEQGVLLFGDFKLKSGGQTPYFFNLGNVSTGPGLLELGRSYARCISTQSLSPDVIFGPAYKGIPLSVVAAIGLAEQGIDVGLAFNRKEAKDRGEGGMLIGTNMADKNVLVIDDVIVDGAAKVESVEIIEQAGGHVTGILIAIDRCEILENNQTGAEALSSKLDLPVYSVANLHDVIEFLKQDPSHSENLTKLLSYAETHCKLS